VTASFLMGAFAGRQPSEVVLDRLTRRPPAGVTLFRYHNVGRAAEIRALTDALQAAVASEDAPLLIAADQEGGQLLGLGADTTPFAGAMALGAAGDEALAERVARATALEMRALGVNVNYAPVCDLATNPANPSLGIRSFGDDPVAVAGLVAATVRGLQAVGVAATAKHFPGKGDAGVDTHHLLAVVQRSAEELEERELVPFRAAIEAGARLVMTGHFALPGLTGDDQLPASLARSVLTGLLRERLGFDGLSITDALDMRALPQGEAQAHVAVSALRAGADLLLGTPDDVALMRLETAVLEAKDHDRLLSEGLAQTRRRLAGLRRWLSSFDQPALEVVGCAEHRALALELAERATTLVRDDQRLLPLRPAADQRVLVITPRPADLTPADTSSYLTVGLADAIRRRHGPTDELVTASPPTAADIAEASQRSAASDLVVLGTLSAALQPAQAALASAVLDAAPAAVSVALRTPWDLTVYPQARTHALTYGIQPDSIAALAAALFGEIPFGGRLPVTLGSLYPGGHGR
jgi:beta-N-acetylhexosaminidase